MCVPAAEEAQVLAVRRSLQQSPTTTFPLPPHTHPPAALQVQLVHLLGDVLGEQGALAAHVLLEGGHLQVDGGAGRRMGRWHQNTERLGQKGGQTMCNRPGMPDSRPNALDHIGWATRRLHNIRLSVRPAHRPRDVLHLILHVPVLDGRQVANGVPHGDGAQGGADLARNNRRHTGRR